MHALILLHSCSFTFHCIVCTLKLWCRKKWTKVSSTQVIRYIYSTTQLALNYSASHHSRILTYLNTDKMEDNREEEETILCVRTKQTG